MALCLVPWRHSDAGAWRRDFRTVTAETARVTLANPPASRLGRMSRAPILPFVLSLSLAGCASYSGIQGEAHALVPQSLAFDQNPGGGDWPREDWWTMFGDPKLDALMPRGPRGHPRPPGAPAPRPPPGRAP